MKDFFKSLVASLVALSLFVGGGLVLLVIIAASMGPTKPVVPAKAVLILDLNTNFTDSYAEPGPAELLQKAAGGGQAEGVPLHVLVQALDRASHDAGLSALYITGIVRPEGVGSGPAALKELREAILRFRKVSGKPVIAYNQYWTKRELYLCAGVGKVYMNPLGVLDATGYASEVTFYGKAFKKYGVDVQVTRVGKYKSAVEPYVLEKLSDPAREELQVLMGDLWTEWKSAVAADRKLTPERLQAIADEQGTLTSPEALKEGLVDKLLANDQVLDELKEIAGRKTSDRDFPQIDMATYAKTLPEATGSNRIALVFAEGSIVDGMGASGSIGGESLSNELRRLRLDKRVKAIVLRVNSPGGSAPASELIQRELVLARKDKPVIVSMGHLAASGGYWISTYADRIFAEPTTITGSIGVFGLLPNVKSLANEHGITWDGVQTAKLANSLTISRPKTDAELARAQVMVDWIYDLFVTKVAESRKLTRDQVQEIAQGRVWSGASAIRIGLVDEIGSLQDAVAFAAKKAKIESDYRLEGPTEPRTAVEKLLKALSGGKRQFTRSSADTLQGQVQHVISGLEAFSDPRGIYARMPYDLTIR
ncbi:MAG: signal peptide peptidase SppA [Holophaga sp.]|nr:signal peptide peptidase SppA [Holophaga sp.]